MIADLERDSKQQYVYTNTFQVWECWQARARLDGTQLLALHDDLMKKI